MQWSVCFTIKGYLSLAPITCHSGTRHVMANFHMSLAPNTRV
jgi:hypothetical protein